MPDRTIRQQILSQVRQIVVKVGTNAVCEPTGRLDIKGIRGLARQIARLMRDGRQVTLVASGAIGAGLAELNLPERPKTMPELQAVAAIGQGQLMRAFHDVLARYEIRAAQVLVTRDDFEDRTRYLNIRNTLRVLHEYGALAVINENDAVAVDEIRYGDNDIIAAHVTNMLSAEALIFLTSVDGVMDGRVVMDVIRQVDDDTLSLVEAHHSHLGSGGMASKITAATMVTRAGDIVIVANAHTPNVLTRVLSGKRLGTLFVPSSRKMSSRRRWIGLASRPAGKLTVDDGAVQALAEEGKSLLPRGIVAVAGTFKKGATVSVLAPDGQEVARGLTNYGSDQLERIKGFRTTQIARILGDKPYDEAIHRNNMTVK